MGRGNKNGVRMQYLVNCILAMQWIFYLIVPVQLVISFGKVMNDGFRVRQMA